ncbi:MAG: OprD family porin [Desulfobacterales bacterium]|nr:OprD family porin [Desulfobacterales bacterium]
MSEAAGANVKRGVFGGGARMAYKDFTIGLLDYYSNDIMNIFYTEATYKLSVTDRLGALFMVQFIDQRSVGDDLLKGYSFSTNQVGVMANMGYGGGILTLGYTRASEGADIQNPWGSHPGYTSVQVRDFNRAGENAFTAKASYDFTRLGLEGVAAYVQFVHGWGRVDPANKDSVPNENEFDVDIQWQPQWKFLKGLWFRVRYGNVHQYEGPKNTIHDFRVIVNYDLPLL